MPFSALTYNVLANAYVRRAWYPRSPALVLDPVWRIPALVQHIASSDADLLCLQEVEPETFVALRTFLGGRGFAGHPARKGARRPDGLAIFFRTEKFALVNARVLAYTDGQGTESDSGYIALIALFRWAGDLLGVVDTHLSWDTPNTTAADRVGLRQARQLARELEIVAEEARGWIIGGDFNAPPKSEVVRMLEDAGFRYAHAALPGIATCNANADPRMIDYLFHSQTVAARPRMPIEVDNRTILPSAEQPSDHVVIKAEFDWKE